MLSNKMDNCNKLVLKLSIYSLISINCVICIMIVGIECYLDDTKRLFKQLFIYTTVRHFILTI